MGVGRFVAFRDTDQLRMAFKQHSEQCLVSSAWSPQGWDECVAMDITQKGTEPRCRKGMELVRPEYDFQQCHSQVV